MNEEQFNGDLRKFLKQFGVAAQREIERAVREGLANGTLQADQPVAVRARLQVGDEQVLEIADELRLS